MRPLLQFVGAFLIAIVIFLLHDVLRVSFYPNVRPPLTGTTFDNFFVAIYILCIFVMIGVTIEFAWRVTRKPEDTRPMRASALKSRPTPPQQAPSKPNVFY